MRVWLRVRFMSLLGQLGYDDEAIRQYIYFNLHGYCMVTMDEPAAVGVALDSPR